MYSDTEKLFRRLARSSRKGPSHFAAKYFDSLLAIDEHVHLSDVVKASLASGDVKECSTMLRFAVILNDLTVCTLPTSDPGAQAKINYMSHQWFMDNTGQPPKIYIDKSQVQDLDLSAGFQTGYLTPTGANTEAFLEAVAPLVESGRLVIQPQRLVLAKSKTPHVDGRTMWSAMGSAPFTSVQQWEVTPVSKENAPVPLIYKTSAISDHKSIAEFTLPFIDGVAFNVLAKILNDEQDLLSDVRSSMKSLVDEAKADGATNELLYDVMQPAVDRVERRFKSIVANRSLRVGGASVASMGVTFAAAMTGNIAAFLATGAGGVAGVLNEYAKYREDFDLLRELPNYFWWKCQRAKHK